MLEHVRSLEEAANVLDLVEKALSLCPFVITDLRLVKLPVATKYQKHKHLNAKDNSSRRQGSSKVLDALVRGFLGPARLLIVGHVVLSCGRRLDLRLQRSCVVVRCRCGQFASIEERVGGDRWFERERELTGCRRGRGEGRRMECAREETYSKGIIDDAPTVCRRRVSLLDSGRVEVAKTHNCVRGGDSHPTKTKLRA
jgi:hypothetical protein